MEATILGIDIAKSVFQLHGVDKYGKVVLRKKCSRGEWMKIVANFPPLFDRHGSKTGTLKTRWGQRTSSPKI